jgi:RNA polymerase sigma-70 factor (ECF subfamily)
MGVLQQAWEEAKERHAGIDVSWPVYRSFVRQRLADEVPNEEIAADLYLVCACASGDDQALAAFDAHYLGQVPQLVAKVESNAAAADEVKQRVRERLLLPRDGRIRLAEYGGQGRLASWLRVVALRVALDMRGGRKEAALSDGVSDRLMANDDPEMEYLRSRYAEQFRAAFVAALGSLQTRERNVLRLHLLDGLNVDRIGQLYDVHRATAARWLAQAREELFRQTRDVLRGELGLTQTEFASIVRLVRSDLDVSICRILRENQSQVGP